MPTPKQEKLIKLIMENYGNKESTKTMGELLIQAGYTEETAKNPQLIFQSEAIQEGISDFVKDMEDKRKNALKEITDAKLKKSSAKDNVHIVDTLTKNIQLLSGKETESNKVTIELVNYKDE